MILPQLKQSLTGNHLKLLLCSYKLASRIFLHRQKYIIQALKSEFVRNFDELSPNKQDQAIRDKELATRYKYYEMAILGYNKHVYGAMKLDRRLWEPFTCCKLFSNGSMVPLRSCLIRISQDWNSLGLPGTYPFAFTRQELEEHDKQVTQYKDRIYSGPPRTGGRYH